MDAQIIRLVASFDCAREYPPEEYFGHEDVRVVDSPLGRYREAGASPFSRFGYRFHVESVGRPHLLVVTYPDDKRRYMCVMDGTCYDLTTGVFTGFSQPLSGEMLQIRQVFWPRWEDCSVTFMTWGHGEPAAVATFEVHELGDLPPLDVPGDPGDGTHREFGIQFEDPCGTGASLGALTFEEWMDRVVEYARHTGQKHFVYPVAWYHGPRFPSEREPSDDFRMVVAPDRKQYSWWTTSPHDWVEDLLQRFDDAGLEFQASMTLLRLGSLLQAMNVDQDAVAAGAETYNNMLYCDHVQAGTQDWTPVYNARNYAAMLQQGRDCVSFSDIPLAYGEKTGQPYPAGPMFNPLHPTVQEAIIGFVREVAERYSGHESFTGISINLWHSTFAWFASLRCGYDDYTVGLFEQETGITVPIDAKDPHRFSKRHEFLLRVCRDTWIDWRCAKIHELVCRLRDTLTDVEPYLLLTLTVWNEMTVPAVLGPIGASHQLNARGSARDLYREGGLDLELYQEEDNLCIDLQLEPARDRGLWGAGGDQTPVEQATMFHDFDFLDTQTHRAMESQARPGAFIFNSWVEAWGEHRWFACEEGDPMPERIAADYHSQLGDDTGVFRMNSVYPEDGFWWDSQLRITPAFPAGDHFMEHYAHAVAEFDALRITRGGLILDTAHAAQLQRFALAYRALPAERFELEGDTVDPVVFRSRWVDGVRYLYVVNREYYPVGATLILGDERVWATDLSTGKRKRVGREWSLTLGPYELRSFALPGKCRVDDTSVSVPPEIEEALLAEAHRAVVAIEGALAAGSRMPGLQATLDRIFRARLDDAWSALRHLLGSYVVRKCLELRDAPQRSADA